jgi:predicted RNA-binding protein YlxR (DUF448 family)
VDAATENLDQPKGPATHAAASRQRRDLVSGAVRDEADLIRFVVGPDGAVIAVLARKLPGRGLWVAGDRASVETAARKGLFSRAAKTKVSAPADLADQVAAQLRRRLLDGLGLAKRSGALTSGFEKVRAALSSGQVSWLIEAADGAADGRAKVLGLARNIRPEPGVFGLFTSDELGLALGGENVIHTALLAGRASEGWAADVRRLTGFSPLLPPSWREEP